MSDCVERNSAMMAEAAQGAEVFAAGKGLHGSFADI